MEVVRLGEEEEHERWDTLKPMVKRFLGEEESKDEDLMYKLLVQDAVTDALATIKADNDNTVSQAGKLEEMKLQQLIMATKESLQAVKEKSVHAVSESILGNGLVTDDFIAKMMQKKEIVELATQTANKDPWAISPTYAKLLRLMGNERWESA